MEPESLSYPAPESSRSRGPARTIRKCGETRRLEFETDPDAADRLLAFIRNRSEGDIALKREP